MIPDASVLKARACGHGAAGRCILQLRIGYVFRGPMFASARNLVLVALAVFLAGCTASWPEQAGSSAVLGATANVPTATVERPTDAQETSPPGQQRPLSGHRVMYFVESGT